jgi:hypothetical protein
MGEMAVSLLVITCTAVLVGLIFYLVFINKRKTEKALSELAIQKGWRFEPFKETLSWGFRLYGPEWTLESITETTGNSGETAQNNTAQFTRLKSSTSAFPGQLLINPRKAGTPSFSEMNPAILQKLSGLFGSAGFSGLVEIPVGSPQLRINYAIYGKPEQDFSQIFFKRVESILLNWRGEHPWINIRNGGMEIEIRNKNFKKPEEIETLADLANALLSAIKEMQAN